MQSMPPVKGFIPLSFIDWPGRMASVLFTGGCNFRCPFCHNAELVTGFEKMPDIPIGDIISHIRKNKHWVDRIVVTGGEPAIHRDSPALLRTLKAEGMLVKLDTNGSNTDMIRNIVEHGLVDYIAMDVKGPIERYKSWCGVEINTGRIEESICFIMGAGVDYEFRMTVVPTLHSEDDAHSVARYLKGAKRFTLQSFRPTEGILNPSFSEIKAFPDDIMEHLRKICKGIVKA